MRLVLSDSVLKFGKQKGYKSQHIILTTQHVVLESAGEEQKVIGCIAIEKVF